MNFPLANVFFPDSVTAPLTTEYTLSVGGNMTPTLSAAATFISRNTRSFIEDFIDDPSAAGKTDVVYQGVDYGTFDNRRFANSDVPRRRYQALQLQTAFSGVRNLLLQANYTYQLKFEGTIKGEAANAPGLSSVYGNYPEIAALGRTDPYGNLTSYQKHKLRVLGSYQIETPIGAFTPGVIYSFDSGAPYNLTSSANTRRSSSPATPATRASRISRRSSSAPAARTLPEPAAVGPVARLGRADRQVDRAIRAGRDHERFQHPLPRVLQHVRPAEPGRSAGRERPPDDVHQRAPRSARRLQLDRLPDGAAS